MMVDSRQSLKQYAIPDLLEMVEPYLTEAYGFTSRVEGTIFSAQEWQEILLKAVREEMRTLDDIVRLARPVFADCITNITPEAQQALEHEATPDILVAFAKDLPAIEPFDYDTVNEYLRNLRYRFKTERSVSGHEVMFSLRAKLTGTLVGPCLVIIIILLGKSRCLQRIRVT